MRMPSGWKSVIGADRPAKGSNVGRQVKVGPPSMLLHQFVDCCVSCRPARASGGACIGWGSSSEVLPVGCGPIGLLLRSFGRGLGFALGLELRPRHRRWDAVPPSHRRSPGPTPYARPGSSFTGLGGLARMSLGDTGGSPGEWVVVVTGPSGLAGGYTL